MPQGREPVVIFGGGDDGGFYARNVGRDTYHFTYNWDCRPRGTSYPAIAPLRFDNGDTGAAITRVESAIDWEESTGVPFVLGCGRLLIDSDFSVAKFKDGTLDADFKENTSDDRILRAVKYRNDGSDADAEVVWMCNGSGNDGLYELLKDGTFRNTDHTQKFDGLAVVGSDLWGWSGYKIQKNTTDADPGLTGSWQTAIPVGVPSYDINEVVALGNSPVVLKGDGAFIFNPQTGEFDSLTPFLNPHPDNGRGGFTDGRGRVYYPTVDGDVIVITYGYQSQQRLDHVTTFNRETPFGRLTDMTADQEHVYATLDTGEHLCQDGMGLYVMQEDNSSFTNQTSDLTDRSYTTDDETSGDWSLLGTTASNDGIYIGCDVPFSGIWLEIKTALANAGAIVVEYSSGASSFASAPVIWDGTAKLSRPGLIAFADDDITASDYSTPWVTATYNSQTKYWIRISSAAAVFTSLTVSEVKVAPYRPPLDSATFPVTGQMLAGVLPKIVVGTWEGEQLKWDDVWTLEAPAINQMAVSRVGYTQASSTRSLICWADMLTSGNGYGAVFAVPAADSDAARVPFPKLADYSESGTAFDEHAIWFSGHDFGMPHAVKRVGAGVKVEFPGLQSADQAILYAWWDEDAETVTKLGPYHDGHFMTDKPIEGEGQVLYMALQFVDNARDEWAPHLDAVVIPASAWEYDDEERPPKRADQTQPLVR